MKLDSQINNILFISCPEDQIINMSDGDDLFTNEEAEVKRSLRQATVAKFFGETFTDSLKTLMQAIVSFLETKDLELSTIESCWRWQALATQM